MNEAVEVANKSFAELKKVFGVITVAGKTSLTQAEVDTLALEIYSAKQVEKNIKEAVGARTEEVKVVVFAIADAEAGKDEGFTLYSEAHELKMVRTIAETGGGLDETKLLEALYEKFGEEWGDKDGQAWKVWSKITDPVQTRTLNLGKLEAELNKTLESERGLKHGSTSLYLPTDAVEKAKVPPTKQARFGVTKMTAAEKKASKAGTLNK